MKRIIMLLTVAVLMAAMMAASALPALAVGPPGGAVPPGAVLADVIADPHNPAIDVEDGCATLTAPPGSGKGHKSDYPDNCSAG